MKWLKKDSSEDDKKTNVESQPEPEQTIEHVDIDNSKPEALEQPEMDSFESAKLDSLKSTEPISVSPVEESMEKPEEDFPEEEFSEEMPDAFETQEETVDFEGETLQPAEDSTESKIKTHKNGRRRRDRPEEHSSVEQKKPGFNPLTMFARTWIGKNWKTMAILMFIFSLALFVRSYYGVVPATEDGFVLSGGSDSYYHNYVVFYSQDTGEFHFWDDMLNYPVGTRNPRPPLYDMSVSLGGIGASPFFDGDVYTSTNWVFLFSTAFFGALTIIPTYFLAKEAFGRRTGFIAAFLLAIMPGHIQRSVFTNADHDAMALFFIVTTFFFFLKALKLMEQKEWVSTWRKPKVVIDGIKNMIMTNRISLLYAVMTGLSLAAVALIWKGYAYVIVIMSIYLLIQLLVNKFRNADSLGLTATYFVAVGVGLIIAFPYYYQSIQITSWFDTPSYIWLGASVFAMLLVVTRKFPWLMVFSGMIGLGLLGLLAIALLAPSLMDSLSSAVLSGAGYFIQNKQYQTIAEAQAPPFSNLAMSFGIITFWLSFVGIAWAAIQLPKSWKPDFIFIFIWSATSIYMAVTAARFMFNAGPAFAITAGWVIAIILSKLDMKKYVENMKRAAQPHMSTQFKMGLLVSMALLIVMSIVLYTFSSAAYPVFVIGLTAVLGIYILNLIAETNPKKMYNLFAVLIPAMGILFYIMAQFYTDWEFTGATHGFILFVLLFGYFALYMTVRRNSFSFTAGIVFLAFFVVMPNVWGGLDAGIPFEVKSEHDLEIYQAAPIFMQPATYDAINGSNWYLGGFGYSLPLNSRYWPAAYDWLATQDTEIYPPSERPAFISWWDYGFEIVNEGEHPTVADNFLGGHQLAGNFIMSQSEADAIALLSARILEGNWVSLFGTSTNQLDDDVVSIVQEYGIDINKLNDYLENPGDYVDEILAHPEIYGPRDDIIQDANARYILIRTLITEQLDEEEVVNFYSDISDATGDSIRYFGIDSRLFPFSADNTGIFYAPAKLSDHRIDEVGNQPYDFWEIKAIGEFGGEYSLDEIPMDVRLDPNNPYKLVYKDMFYNTMLYKCFVGYSAADTMRPDADGVPGLSGSLAQDPIMPGWNMTHFKLEHRTAYWNPYGAEEIQNHTDAWQAMNYWDAYELQKEGDGIADLSDRSSMYQGVMMLKYYDGAIISGKVTLEDGTPLSSISVTVADDFGIPHQRVVTDSDGSYSIIVPYGDITLIASTGPVDPLSLVGAEMNVTKMHIEDYQAMREDEDRDSNGKPDYLIDLDLIIESGSLDGVVFWDTDMDGNFAETDEIIPNADLSFWNNNLAYSYETEANDTGDYSVEILPPGDYSVDVSVAGISLGQLDITVTSGANRQELLAITPSPLTGTVTFQEDENPVSQAIISLWNIESNLRYSTESDEAGNYTLENIPYGEYFGQAVMEPYASSIVRVNITSDVNNTHDFELVYSSVINGILTLPDGKPATNTIIKFHGQDEAMVHTDSSGHYSAVLRNGIYDIYAEYSMGSDVYAIMDGILLDSNIINYNIILKAGTMINGVITNQNDLPGSNMRIIFEDLDTGFTTRAFTNTLGVYTIKVPQGDYLIQVLSEDDLTLYTTRSFSTRFYVLDISTVEGSVISGKIFWDQNGDDTAADTELLDQAKLIFTDPAGLEARATTNADGEFSIALYPSTSYSVTINKIGFEPISLGVVSPEELSEGINQKMTPITVPILGTLFLGDEPLTDQNIMLSFLAETNGAETKNIQVGRDGTYSGDLIPGIYTVTFTRNITTGNDSQIYQIKEEFDLETGLYVGASIHLDVDAMLRQNIWVSVESPDPMDFNVSFRNGPDNRRFDIQNGTGTYYVMPGDYVLSVLNSDNDTFWVSMMDVTVSNVSSSFITTIEEGNHISGTMTFEGKYIPNHLIEFKDLESNGTITSETDELGTFDIVLAPTNSYQVTVDYVEYDENYEAYHYTLNKTIDSALTVSLSLTLERDEYYTNVSGNLSNGAAGVDITFHSLEGNYTVTTSSLGQYEIPLRPGVYTAYIHDPFSDKVYLNVVIIDIDPVTIDFEMERGYRASGTVYYDLNQHEVTELALLSNISMVPVITDSNGYYELWLPPDEFELIGSLNAQKGDITVLYQLEHSFEIIDRNKQMNLPMAMVEDRSVVLSFDSEQLKETRDNVTVTYSFIVENSGNIRDTYDLSVSGGNPDWTFELSVNEVTLDPGLDNYARVWVIAGISGDTKISQNNINLVATSRNDPTVTHNTIMGVNIRQQHSIVIEPVATSPTFAEGIITSEFAVKNNGNGDDMYTLYIGNLDGIAADGWRVELGSVAGSELLNDNKRVVNVSIVSGGMSNIPIILTPIDVNPARQASVLIIGLSQTDGYAITSHHIIMKYPELQIFTDNVTVVGDEISSVAVGESVTNAGVMVASVTVALGLFYYARKKRWIR